MCIRYFFYDMSERAVRLHAQLDQNLNKNFKIQIAIEVRGQRDEKSPTSRLINLMRRETAVADRMSVFDFDYAHHIKINTC